MRILFVCTANVCRSPVAERLTARWSSSALGPLAATVRVRSRGLDAPEGRAIDPHSAAALRELGIDAGAATARQLHPGEADGADLVLVMTRRHRHELLKIAPRAMRWTFTLPEAADLLGVADTSRLATIPLADRARHLAHELNAARAHRPTSPDDDVRDPIGQSAQVHRQVVGHIATCLEPVTDLLFAPAAARCARA